MSALTARVFGERGRRRAEKLGIDPARLPPGQSPTVKFPVLTIGAAPAVPTATHVLVHAHGGYTTNLPLAAILDDDVLNNDGDPWTEERHNADPQAFRALRRSVRAVGRPPT